MDAPLVSYVRTSDGYDIAYSVTGAGRPLLVSPSPFSHVQLNWQNRFFFPARLPALQSLATKYRLVTFDSRGQGMSTRGLDAETLSMDHFVQDIEAVVEALGLKDFVLFGPGGAGSHIAIHYAHTHRERVAALVLSGAPISMTAYAPGLYSALARENWEYFLQSCLTPGLSPAEVRLGVELLRQSCTQSDWEITWSVLGNSDVGDILPRLDLPVLVTHAQSVILPLEETSRLAARIPGAQSVIVDGGGVLGDTTQFVHAIERFLAGLPAAHTPPSVQARELEGTLSSREAEVLRLLAAGRSNQQIADELVISINTVRRHVSNILDKTGAANRAQAVAYARDRGLD